MFGMGMPEILLILGIALIVIGPKKLPDLAKSLGRALGEFKNATSELKESMQIDNPLEDVKDAFDQLKSDDDKKEKPSADKNKATVDLKTEEALAEDNEDNIDEANPHKDFDSYAPSPSDDESSRDKAPQTSQDAESAEMTDAPLTESGENDTAKDDNVPIDAKPANHQDVTAPDVKKEDI